MHVTLLREVIFTAGVADVVRGDVALDTSRRIVFKTVGMPWEDLAVARALAAVAS